MPRSTVSQRFNLKPEELTAATILAGREGLRGTKDEQAVMANLLLRRLSGKWGHDTRNVMTARGQYAAVNGMNMADLGNPEYAAKVLGGKDEYERILAKINNSDLVEPEISQVGLSFRAPSAGPQKGDYMPVPGKSNFYFDRDSTLAKRALQLFSDPNPVAAQAPPTAPPAVQPGVLETLVFALDKPKTLAQQFVEDAKAKIIDNLLAPKTLLPPIFGNLQP